MCIDNGDNCKTREEILVRKREEMLLTYKNQVLKYSKIAKAMQGGQCLPFLCYLKEVMLMIYHPIYFVDFMKIG